MPSDSAIVRYFSDYPSADSPYRALLETIIVRTAERIATWQAAECVFLCRCDFIRTYAPDNCGPEG